MTSREAILASIRVGLKDVSTPPSPRLRKERAAVAPGDLGAAIPVDDAVLGRFAERLGDYGARVVRVPAASAPQVAAELLADRGAARVAAPSGTDPALTAALAAAGVESQVDTPPLPASVLDAVDGVVTACRVGIAETGTIVLDHAPDQGRRVLTLLPDLHLCLVRADQIVPDVPQAVAALGPSVAAGRPLTWISGPSATVDIEMIRVEGVHGPRKLIVVIAQ
jgi:L-lactate dehydrogenase complex protein LldG